MKICKEVKNSLEANALVNFAGVDDSREVFQYIYIDAKEKVAVATDGRRMIISPFFYETRCNESESKFLNAEWYANSNRMIYEKFEEGKELTYPEWKVIVPSLTSYKPFYFMLPDWIDKMRTVKASVPIYISPEKSLVMIGMPKENYNPEMIQINLLLLKEFAGQSVILFLSEAKKPIVVAPAPDIHGSTKPALTSNWLKKQCWYAVVMPMKCDDPVNNFMEYMK